MCCSSFVQQTLHDASKFCNALAYPKFNTNTHMLHCSAVSFNNMKIYKAAFH